MQSKRIVFLLAVLAVVFGCKPGEVETSSGKTAESNPHRSVVVQLNWYPESEHAGVFAAKAAGLYEKAGLDVTIRAGGQGTRIGPELATGRVQFAFANADDVVLFRQEDVDAVAVMAAMQNHPRCILVRADSGVEKFEDLKGMILQRQPGRPFVTFLERKGLLDGVQLVPYAGSVAALVNTKDTAIQAYSFAEPMLAQEQGVEVRTLMVSDLGWNPYSSLLVTTGDLIRDDREMVSKFVEASLEGWRMYLADPTLAHEAILAVNEEGMTKEALSFGYEGLKKLALPDGMAAERVGLMTSERWGQLVDQMAEMELIDSGKVRASECYTTEFLGFE